MKALTIYITELRQNSIWHLLWLVFLLSYALWMYDLWLTFLFPFLVIGLLIYTMTSGVRAGVQSITNKTGELLHTLPVSRKEFLSVRILANLTPIILFFCIQYAFLTIHSFGLVGLVDQNKILTITFWGMLFGLFGLLLGLFLGILTGNTSKGLQLSLMVVLISFTSQTLINMNTSLSSLADFIPLDYYQPGQYLLFKSFVKDSTLFSVSFHLYPVLLVVLSVLLLCCSLIIFNRKDLLNDAGINFPYFHKIKALKTNWATSIIFPKQVRNGPFVFWGRIFENKFPMIADFIYSDNVVLAIACFALFFLFPFQISYYPGNSAVEHSIHTFGQSNVFSIFRYGHNLNNTPYLWFLVVNTIGLIWVIFLPLTFVWVTKSIRRDGNDGYGEILGGLSLNNRNVVIQRMIAIFLELIFLDFVTIFMLLFTEALNGQTYDKVWEILAIISMIPLYMFLITFSMILALLFKERGGVLIEIFLITIIGTFILSFLVQSLNTWYMKGLFSLYDPVLIIEKKSLLVNSAGVLVLLLMDCLTILGLISIGSRYTWLNVTDKGKLLKSTN